MFLPQTFTAQVAVLAFDELCAGDIQEPLHHMEVRLILHN